MKRWYGLIAFAIALAMLGVMACGGDDDETLTPFPTIPRQVPQPAAISATVAPVPTVAPSPTPAPAATAEPTVREGGTLRWFVEATIPNLDAVRTTATVSWYVTSQMYDGLFGWDLNKETQPQMVGTWTVDADAKNYTFTLRDGLTFHDGAPVTAADAVTSLSRWLTGVGGGRMYKIAGGVDAQVVDSNTFALQVGTETGDPFGLWVVYWGRGAIQIVPKRVLEGLGEEEIMPENIGSGPKKFVSWDPGNMVLLAKYEDYVGRSEPNSADTGNRTSHLDFVQLFEVPDHTSRMAALQTRQADYATNMPDDFYKTILNSDGLAIDIVPEYQRNMIATNKTQVPLNNTNALKALLAGVELERWMTAMHGPRELWTLCAAQYHCDGPFASTAGEEAYFEFDLEKGKRLWTQAMQETGFTGKMVLLTTPDYPAHYAGALLLKEMLEAYGADVDFVVSDWATVISRKIQNLNNPPEEGGWHFYITSDSMWDPVQDDSVGTTWNGGYPNPQVHQMVKDFAASKSQAEAKAIVDEIQRIYYEDQPGNINIGWYSSLHTRQDYVKGSRTHPRVNIDNVWLAPH